jgi:hypothetical protein
MLQNRSLLQQWAAVQLPSSQGSLKQFNAGSAEVLSLADLLNGSSGKLRLEAQQLRDRLEQCLACLLDNLRPLPPSVRLQWAQLAEDDRLSVDRVEAWPGLERAEAEEFNAVRTVAELVDWWFRQLAAGASGGGRSALRNMIRASLITASLGDPAEILHGHVQVAPRRFLAGETLRLKLNRSVTPGTQLQLLDLRQRVVGMLTVEDQDEQGVLANIARVDKTEVSVDTGFTVVASKRIGQLP